MRFGVNILNFGPGASPRVLSRWALSAENLGYHFVMISDHVAITPDVQAHYPVPFYDPFITLAWLAGITRKVELGTTVAILPYRHPLETARAAAEIDQVSGGRFIFGVGVGWAKQEFEALGARFEKRGEISDEYLATVKDCWTKDVVSRKGEFVSFKHVHTAPKPVRSPHPPIWVGGSSEPALRRAVKYGEAWHPIHEPISWLREKGIPGLQRLADSEGKRVPDFCPRIRLQITEKSLDDETRLPGQGTLDQIRDDLESLRTMGAQYVLFDTYSGKPEERREPEADWLMFETLADRLLDLGRQAVR